MVETRPVSDLSDSLIQSKIIDNIKKEEIQSGETLGCGMMKFNAEDDFLDSKGPIDIKLLLKETMPRQNAPSPYKQNQSSLASTDQFMKSEDTAYYSTCIKRVPANLDITHDDAPMP